MNNASGLQINNGDISGRTTGTVLEPGLYESDCCYQELLFEQNDCFCRCPRCQRLCQWDLLQSVVPVAKLDACSDENWLTKDDDKVEYEPEIELAEVLA